MSITNNLATIIVPVYKVEKYIDRCINSIVNQTYRDLEIIIIDDGSPDHCPKICDEWAKKDNRIQVIHKENNGLGMARNTGIENASGEYILFIDSDDYIALDTIERVMEKAKQTDADMIMYGSYSVDKEGNIRNCYRLNTNKDYYQYREILDLILPDMLSLNPRGVNTNLGMSACMIAYKRFLIQRTGWRFVSERELISEDIYSNLCLMKAVESVAIISEALYYYCDNFSSLSRSYRSDRYESLKKFYDACIEKCNELEYSQVVKDRFKMRYMNNIIGALKLIVTSEMTDVKKKQYINEIICDDHLQSVIQSIKIQQEKLTRKLLFIFMRLRMSRLVYFLFREKYKPHCSK